MSRSTLSTQQLFLSLGSTPRTRSVRADQLFRKLREDNLAAEEKKLKPIAKQENEPTDETQPSE